MRWSVALPGRDAPPELRTPDALADAARTLEELGFDACWLTDHPFPVLDPGGLPHHAYDPFTAFGFVAGATSRIRLHTNIVVLPYRNPFIVASAAATLDYLSGGRLILGVGVGYFEPEFAALGAEFARRAETTREGIEAIKAAWTGERVELRSPRFEAVGNTMPRPAQEPWPPIWRGGNSLEAIAHAVAACDGWVPFETPSDKARRAYTAGMSGLGDLRARLPRLRQLMDESGRSDAFDVCFVRSPTAWLARPEQAIREELDELAELGVTWLAPKLADARSPAEFAEHARSLAEIAGVRSARPSSG